MKSLIFLLLGLTLLVNLNPSESTGSGRLLSDWIDLHLQLVRAEPEMAQVACSRHFAYVSTGFYEAVTPTRQPGEKSGLPQPPSPLLPDISGNAAYAAMLHYFYGFNKKAALIDSFENARLRKLAAGQPERQVKASVDFGKAVAKAIIARAENDRSDWARAAKRSENGGPSGLAAAAADFGDASPGTGNAGGPGQWAPVLAQEISEKDLPLLQSAKIFAQTAVGRYQASLRETNRENGLRVRVSIDGHLQVIP